jgi:hypothetical protein
MKMPAMRPATAASLSHGMSHQSRRGHFTASKHAATNPTGLTHGAASTSWMRASTSTGHTGSGVAVITAPLWQHAELRSCRFLRVPRRAGRRFIESRLLTSRSRTFRGSIS